MSEPYSAMAQFQISRSALKSYLAAPARPTSQWSDWSDMCGREDATGQQDGLPFSLHGEMDFDSVDRWLSEGDYRWHLRDILGVAELPSLARFDYDADTGLATVVNLTVGAECFRNPLWFLATVRGAAGYVDDTGGVAVIRQYLWGGPESKYTMAVLRLERGRTRFLHSADDADAYSDAVRRANTACNDIGHGSDRLTPDDTEAVANLDRI
ncbi:hypothetical protein [Nocardia sp. NPDC046763]|uniref:hypothetical protein n=1 Tax=Nocardia sp. NPDC046763 TaxID=3155256 RepID=UPI00340739DC